MLFHYSADPRLTEKKVQGNTKYRKNKDQHRPGELIRWIDLFIYDPQNNQKTYGLHSDRHPSGVFHKPEKGDQQPCQLHNKSQSYIKNSIK